MLTLSKKEILQEKQWRPPNKKKKKGKKLKPEEHEGTPQHQHCPPEKRRGDGNPECHEEQQKHTPDAIERNHHQKMSYKLFILNVMKIEKNQFINHRSVASIP
jgi:hypothetical protein